MLENNDWIDPHLKFVLSKTYKRSENEITKFFLANLEELDLSAKNITSLKGLQYANNIKSLILNKNNIKNANQLKSLTNLTNLDLSENKLEDVFFLTNLKKIKTVNLESNNISEIPDLSYLRKLESINISNNKIANLCFIDNIYLRNIRIIATDQVILLKPLLIYQNSDYTFEPQLFWNKDTVVCYDNIQVSGEYDIVETNERPSMLYSISRSTIRKIKSDCIIKVDFYHEVMFPKSGIFSGIVIQQLILKTNKDTFDIEKIKIDQSIGIIYGDIKSQVRTSEKKINTNIIYNRVITLIDSKGNTQYRRTNFNGEFEFDNLVYDRYTLVFPFIFGYKYLSPSLYIFNLNNDECIEIHSTIVME